MHGTNLGYVIIIQNYFISEARPILGKQNENEDLKLWPYDTENRYIKCNMSDLNNIFYYIML